MSTKSQIKQIIFDSIFVAYSLIVAYFSIRLATQSSETISPGLNQDAFVSALPVFSTIIIILIILSTPAAWLASKKGVRTVGVVLFGPPRVHVQRPFLGTFHGLHLSLTFLLTIYVSLWMTEVSFSQLFDQEGLAGAARLWLGLANPNWALLERAIVEGVETIFIAFLATVLAVPVAFLVSFFAAKNLMKGSKALVVYAILRIVLNISRSIEPLVWALIFTVWVGVGPFAGMLALFLHSVASLIKYYSEVIEGTSEGPLDAIRSTGANPIQIVWFGVVPQIILPYIAMTLYRWDTNVRMATVIGLVGGGGIGTLLITYQGQGMWREVGCIIFVIAVIVWLMDTASALIREALK